MSGTEIVISGIGGKFPETDNVLQLQEKLFAKEDFVTNDSRWTSDTVSVGKIRDIDTFDSSPFKMHSKLVRACDPTTTQTLERAFEAIIDAGMNPFAMSGRNIAVVSASMVSDSENTRAGSSYESSGFTIMGHNRAMVANRISYTFNFTGPSYSIHTSWEGGVRALEQGAQLIAQGFAEAAVVTTASLIFFRATGIEYEGLKILKPGGRCHSFDADANGTCRSEGVISFFLQKACDAKRNYATVVGLTSSCLGQRACSLIHYDSMLSKGLKDFYKDNNIDVEDIAYLEADGSGVKYLDTIELNSLSSVFFEKRKKPLDIGSVKSNVGNTEASSSFLGITKSIIAMETGLIPPNIHYKSPNPDVPALVNKQFKPVTQATKLQGDLVAISTLSLGGNVGHVVLRRNTKEKQVLTQGELPPDGLHRLIMVSARHEEGAKLISEKLQSCPVDVEYASLVNDVFKSNVPGYLWKSFVVVPSPEVKYNIKKYDNVKQPLWYVFSGMGSQWTGMGRDLLRLPLFSAAVDKCDTVLRPRGIDIRQILTTDDPNVLDNILNCFVAIATVQIGLVDILRAVGLEPDGMVGHSVGELGCAYADGCFTAEEMVLAAYARGKASLESDVIRGMMAAVGLGFKDIIDRVPPSVDVACHNSSDSCTLSGPTDDVVDYVKQLKDQKIFAKAVSAGNIAYHSRYIRPIAPKLLYYLSELIKEPKPRSTKWVSSSVPEADWSAPSAQYSSAEYHTNNLLSPVLFEEACRHIPSNAIVIEIAPHGLLQAILRRSLGDTCVNIPLTNRQATNGVHYLLEALGTLYLNNVNLDVNALYPPVQYPVSRGTPYISPLITWDHHESWFKEFQTILLMMARSNEVDFELNERVEEFALSKNHRIEGKIVLPASQILVSVWNMFCTLNSLEFKNEAVLFEDMVFSKQIAIKSYFQQLVIAIRRGTSSFEVCSKGKDGPPKLCLSGIVKQATKPKLDVLMEDEEGDRTEFEISGAEVLNILSQFGYQLGPQFQAIKHVLLKNRGFTARVEWTGDMVTFLDAVFKVVLFLEMEMKQKFLYPSSFRKLIIDSPAFFKLEIGTEVEVFYDSRTNVLQCKGLLLTGLTMSPDPSIQNKAVPLNWRKKSFVPFNSDKLKLDDFVSVCIQLVGEEGLNIWRDKVTQLSVVEIRDNNGTHSLLAKPLRDIISSLGHISMKIQEMELSQAKKKLIFKPGESYLVVGGYNALEQIAETAESSVFLLAHVHKPQPATHISDRLRPVLVHHMKDGSKLILFRKACDVKKLRVLELEREHWLTDLSQLFNGGDDGQPVAVVSRQWRPSDILPTLAKQKYAHRLKCVFLDKSSPKFSTSAATYHHQLSLGLSVSMMSGGVWGTNCTLCVDTDTLHLHDNVQSVITSSDTRLAVNVIALNKSTVTFQPDKTPKTPGKVDVQFVDYCGTKDSERVMGLAHYNSLTNTLTPSHSLCWPIPQDWSMEEAATVPVVFTLAYYSILVQAQLQAGETVLIHVGSCPVSQACIAVALEAGADLFVTIQNDSQRAPLLQAFPQLKPDHVLPLHHFSTHIKNKTRGIGVRIVVNCLRFSGLSESMRSVDHFSRIINFCDVDIRDREAMNLGMFLKSSHMFGISVSNLLHADEATSMRLQKLMKEGLKKGVVRPLRNRTFGLQSLSKALDHLMLHDCEEKTLVVVKPEDHKNLPNQPLRGFHCETDKTYIIVGSGDGLWVDVAEWLVQHGARKLFIAPIKDNPTTSFSRRFDRLVALCYVRIMLTSITRLDSHADAVDFLREAQTLGPVSAIFCTGLPDNCPQVAHLDSAVRLLVPHLKQFVCLLGGSASVCESRAQLGLPSTLVLSKTPLLKPQAVLPYLTSLLTDNSSTGCVFMVRDQESKSNQEDSSLTDQDPCGLLPSSVVELATLASSVTARPMLREVATLSPRHEFVQYNILPVFILPGSHSARLQPFLVHLMHPAYCATLPALQHSTEHTAELLLQEVLKIQKQGPYNVVGELWGGALALRLATLLEVRGHTVALFLLDAAPATGQQWARALCDKVKYSLDTSLLATTLDLSEQSLKQLIGENSWDDRLQAALKLVQAEPIVLQAARRGLSALHSHLTALLAHTPPDHLFKGNVHLIRPKGASEDDLCSLQLFCLQRPSIYIMEDESHEQMLKNPDCATIINKNIIYTWDL